MLSVAISIDSTLNAAAVKFSAGLLAISVFLCEDPALHSSTATCSVTSAVSNAGLKRHHLLAAGPGSKNQQLCQRCVPAP